jgi:hypothetical protein
VIGSTSTLFTLIDSTSVQIAHRSVSTLLFYSEAGYHSRLAKLGVYMREKEEKGLCAVGMN